ncbi:MAG TPA: hypothetical protein VJ835_09405 [Fimbriimonadaceae bacterium]|nr:hypothetical protein [Fimbriimonadaceae bacterium]
MVLANIEEVIFAFIPIVVFMVPIIAILTHHQRKMAELIHRAPQALPSPEVEALRREVQDLKALIHQQTIALDNARKLEETVRS